jgi:hypothetical protein
VSSTLDRADRLMMLLLGLAAGLALFLGTVGLYSVLAYSVSREQKDIGRALTAVGLAAGFVGWRADDAHVAGSAVRRVGARSAHVYGGGHDTGRDGDGSELHSGQACR